MVDQSPDYSSTAPTGVADPTLPDLTDLPDLADLTPEVTGPVTDTRDDAADAETETEAEAEVEPALPPHPPADRTALVVAIAVPLVGALLTLLGRTWLTVAFLMLMPVIGVVYGLGLLAFVRVLRRRSMLRRELGAVPTRYRVFAWVWALAFLLSALSPILGGVDLPWELQAGLVGVSAVAAGVVTGALWSTYLRDVAWIESRR